MLLTCYKDLLDYSDELRRYGYQRIAAEKLGNAVPEPPKVISEHDAILFASGPVRSCFHEALDLAVKIHAQRLMMTKLESSDSDDAKKTRDETNMWGLILANKASELGFELEQVIKKDVESGGSKRRTINWLSIPKVFFAKLRKKPGSVQAAPG